ncbi:MAG: hypothetical protein ACOZF0_14320 [Thermodesulfobacteriota bacterium]
MLYYSKYLAVLLAALILGRWFDQERKRLRAQGLPWHHAWRTTPGVIIIICIGLLIALRLLLSFRLPGGW